MCRIRTATGEAIASIVVVTLLASALGAGVVLQGSALASGQPTGEDAAVASAGVQQTPASLRVVHASPDAPPVDLLVDGEIAVDGVSFGNASDYLELEPGSYNVTVVSADDPDEVLFRSALGLRADSRYTVTVAGEASPDARTELVTLVQADDSPPPAPNESTVRLLHLSPDAPTVDVVANGTTLFDNVSYRNVTPYTTVRPGNYTIEVRTAAPDDEGTVVATFDVAFEAGTAASAFAIGYLDPDGAPADRPFDLRVVTDVTNSTA